MTSIPDRPDFAAPDFVGCYRHPDRTTGIRCQRCQQPICGECMQPASVGFQCPKCVGRGRAETRQPRTRFGGRLSTREAPVTTVLIVVLVGLYILDAISRGIVSGLLAQYNAAISAGQFWRLVTSGFISVGLFNTLLSGLVLYLIGRALEGMLGSSRFLILYVLCGLGAATVMFVVGPPGLSTAGGSVIGLLAANAALKLQTREDIKPDLILLALLVGVNFAIGSVYGGLGQLGGALTGLLAGLVFAYSPRGRRTPAQVVGLGGIVLICGLAVAAKVALV